MGALFNRNVKLYYKDKINVFLSLLSVLIIIGLFVLVLGDMILTSWMRDLAQAEVLMYSWLAAGVVAVAAITIATGAFDVVVGDRVKKINKGFYVSPIKRRAIVSGYILGGFVVVVTMTLVVFVLWSAYIRMIGGSLLTLTGYLQALGVILLSGFLGTSIVYFIATVTRSHSAFNTIATIMGTLMGFLMGIYFPVGALPDTVQTVVKLFPPAHGGMLLRRIIMAPAMDDSFYGIPMEHVEEFREAMGMVFRFGEFEFTPVWSVMMMLVTAAAFYGLSMLSMRKIGR